jgi:predicted DNA-binding mobile mystery protein A
MHIGQAIQALEQRLAPLRSWSPSRPPKGWLRAIRDALGMTTGQYAERLNVKQPRIIALEKSEMDETASLATMRRAAEALGCRFVYAIVPEKPLDQMLREQAALTADVQLRRTNHTMRLESQGMTEADFESARERLIDELLRGNIRRLWDAA